MAFKAKPKSPQFADLKGILSQSKETDNPLYQVVQELIERLTQLKLITLEDVEGAIPEEKPILPQIPAPHAPTHMPGGTDVLPVTTASKLLGRGSVSAGPVEEIALGTGIAMSGTTLNATGGATPGPHASTHVAAGTDPVNVTTLLGYTGETDKFLRADKTFNVPPVLVHGSSHLQSGGDPVDIRSLPGFSGTTDTFLRGDRIFGNILGAITANSILETAIIDGTLLARNAANETIAGSWKFANAITSFEGGDVQVVIRNTAGGTNEKYWRIIATSNRLIFQTLDDAGANGNTIFDFVRSGNTSQLVRMHCGVGNPSRSSVSVSGDQTAWNPTGLGSVFQISATPSVPLTIRGILAQVDGFTFVLTNATSNVINIPHNDGAVSVANRILTPGGATIAMGTHSNIQLYYEGGFPGWRVIAKSL